MFNLTLSWDMFIVVFFAIVMSYSFIIGKHQSVRVIIASYIGIIATQGIGNVFTRFLSGSQESLVNLGVPIDINVMALGKIFLFALCVIVFVTRSGIDVSYEKDPGRILTIVYTGLFGFSTAGLIVSTVLTYASGGAILDSTMIAQGGIAMIVKGSTLMQLMILNQDIWYTLPAFLIVATGFVHND